MFAAEDGSERQVTWRELDARANQIARSLQERGLALGDRLALVLRNSPELVESVIAAWKLGAVPVPVRWNLPDWERRRVDVVDAKVTLDAASIPWLDGSTELDASPLPNLVSPQTHRICSSGSTGTPEVSLMERPAVWILQGAAVIGPALVQRWLDLVGPEHFFMAYGMTEGLGLAALRGDEWLAHPGSVGRGDRGTEIRVLGPDGEDAPSGEVGEIFLRSPMSGMYRYLGGAPLLATTEDGFGTAGDLGFLDDNGFLHVVDRRVDLIISGGTNVYPAEVESALIEHPAIADVVVVGLADPEWGRRVHAIVEPADPSSPPSSDEVFAFAKARLAPYKVPKTVELVEAIPRTEATEARGG